MTLEEFFRRLGAGACEFPETDHRAASLSGAWSETPNIQFVRHQAFNGDGKDHLKNVSFNVGNQIY